MGYPKPGGTFFNLNSLKYWGGNLVHLAMQHGEKNTATINTEGHSRKEGVSLHASTRTSAGEK